MKNAHIKEIRIPVQVVLGEKELTLEEIASIGEGTIIQLDSLAGEPSGRLLRHPHDGEGVDRCASNAQ